MHSYLYYFWRFITITILCLGSMGMARAQTNETIPIGSRIINMGITPQTTANGLKPYGLVYALLDAGIPVKWAISVSKSFGDPDFTYMGTAYRGGTFIIPAPITAAANTIITAWIAQGVQVSAATTSTFIAPIHLTLKMAPRVTLDAKNGGIAQGYLTAAGVPAAYYYFKDPQLLNCCDDVYAMPHADPTWATHSNLYNWNLTCKGAIWAACHAVSALENSFNPANKSQQLNFLSNTTAGLPAGTGPYPPSPGNSLVLWGAHNDGTLPPAYQKAYPTEPPMQFMGQTDAAQSNGSEQIYMPVNGTTWRASTKIGVWDDSQPDVVPFGMLSQGKAAKIAYGQGFGDPARGKVMYEGGHSHAGTAPDNIAAQRAFLNFVLWAGQDKAFVITNNNIPATIPGGTTITGVNATLVAPVPSGPYNYTWSSSCGGTFTNASGTFANVANAATATATSFTAPAAPSSSFPCVITCRITDACGRKVFETSNPTIQSVLAPPVAVDDSKSTTPGTMVTVTPLTNDSDPNLDPINVTQLIGSTTTANGQFYLSGNSVMYLPNPGFVGTDFIDYEICDPGPLCDIGRITITIAENPGPCGPNGSYVKLGTAQARSYSGVTNVNNPDKALGAPDVSNYAELEKSTGVFILDLGRTLNIGDTVLLRMATQDLGVGANQFSIFKVEGAATAIGSFSGAAVTINTPSKAFTDYKYIITAANTRYLRIQNTGAYSKGRIDAVTYNFFGCILKCTASEITTQSTKYGSAVFSQSGVSNSGNITGAPDGSNAEFGSGDAMILDLGEVLPATGIVKFYMVLNGGSSLTSSINVAGSTTTSGFAGSATFTVQTSNAYASYYYTIPAGGARYLQINGWTGDKNIRIDAAEFISVICTTAMPTAVNDAVTICEDGSVVLRPLRNDSDPQGLPLSVTIITPPTKGIAAVSMDGSVSYTGNPNQSGTDVLTYKACNTLGFCAQATITFTITDDGCTDGTETKAPIVTSTTAPALNPSADTYLEQNSFDENHGDETTFLIKDKTGDNMRALLRFALPTLPVDAVITSATLRLTKTSGDDDGLNVSVHRVNSAWDEGTGANPGDASWINRKPLTAWTTAGGDFVATPLATTNVGTEANYTWNVTAAVKDWLDNGVTNNGLLVKFASESNLVKSMTFASRENGTSSEHPTLTITYTTVTGCAVTCTPIPQRPPIAAIDEACTNYNQAITVNVAANDTDPDGNLNPISVIVLPNHLGSGYPQFGTATASGGSITYTPNPGSVQKDRIYYQIFDSSSPTPLSDISYLDICIRNVPITAVDDNATTPSDTPVSIPVYTNDINPLGGSVTISPDPMYPPVNGGTIAIVGNNIVYTPAPGFTGVDQFQYILCNSNFPPSCDIALVTVTVTNLPAPVAANDFVTTATCYPVTINVLDNDTDNQGNNLIVTGVTQPSPTSLGVATFTATTVTFTPSATATGTFTFNYTIIDDGATPQSATGTVTVTIAAAPVNNAPIAVNDAETGPKNNSVYVNVNDNDSDPDGNSFKVTRVSGAGLTGPSNGTVSLLPNGLVLYTPNSGFVGVDQFEYEICDEVPATSGCSPIPSLCSKALVQVTIFQVPIPLPVPDNATTLVNTPITINVTGNDEFGLDGPNTATAITITGPTSNGGTVTVVNGGTGTQADDQILYTPAPGFVGTETFKYTICDATSPTPDCAETIVTVVVSSSIVPVTESGTVSSATGGTALTNIAGNDQVNGLPATLGGTGNATVAVVGTWPAGITLDPTTGAVSVAIGTVPGVYSITYKLCDKLTPQNCADMVDQVTVTPSIIPVTESGTVSSATGGTALTNIAGNDQVNGFPATLGGTGNATVAVVGTWPAGITLDPTTGAVSVAIGTVPGVYSITYKLCDKLTPQNCADMVDQVTVTPSIVPVTESGTVSTLTGGTALTNIAGNDQVNGLPATLGGTGNATVAVVGTWPAGITLDPTTGAVSVAIGTVPGVYSITYKLCDKLTPQNCADMVDQVTVTLEKIKVIKSIAAIIDNAPTGIGVGDVINYSFTVTNTGNVPLTAVSISDPLLGANLTGGPISLAVGASNTTAFTGTYTITQADINAGGVQNTATATGTPPSGPAVTDISDTGTDGNAAALTDPDATESPKLNGTSDTDPTNDPTVLLIAPAPSIKVIKSVASVTPAGAAGSLGDVINYTFTVTNTGNVPLTAVSISDPLLGANLTGGPISLAVGASNTTAFTGTYTITQADINAGGVQNTATATGTPPNKPDGSPSTPVTDVSDTGTDGNAAALTDPDATESPKLNGTSDTDPTNDPTVLLIAPAPSIKVIKSVASVTPAGAAGSLGDVINYTFTVTNTGNVPLTAVSISDPLLGANLTGGPISLAVGASDAATFTGTYTITQADINAGGVQNTATATGTPPNKPDGTPSTPVTDVSDTGTDGNAAALTDPDATESPKLNGTSDTDPTNDPTVLLIAPAPSIKVIKSVASVTDNAPTGTGVGDVINYSFTVTNTGNVPLTAVSISDPLLGANLTGGPISLAVGASDAATFTGTYTITQADINAGGVQNTATATGTPPNKPDGSPSTPVTDISDTGTDGNAAALTDPDATESPKLNGTSDTDPTNDPTVLLIAPAPSIKVIKSVASVTDNAPTGTGVGDVINYTFTVTNTGNVPLTAVSISDPLLGANLTGGPISLAVGASDAATFTGTYTITQADINAGGVQNTATATGTPPNKPDGSPSTPVTDVSDTGTDGNAAALTDPDATESPKLNGTSDTDPTNDPTVLLITPAPSIKVIKSVASVTDNAPTGTGVGDVINYSFTVTNTGNVPLTAVSISDPLLGANLTGGPISLAVGASDAATFTGTYTITQADINAGGVQNTATATGTPPNKPDGTPSTPVTDVSDTGTDGNAAALTDPDATESPKLNGTSDADPTNDPTVLLIQQSPKIGVAKLVTSFTDNNNGTFDVTFGIKVKNLGNVPLSNLQVFDTLSKTFPSPATTSVIGLSSTKFTVNLAGYTGTGSSMDMLLAGNSLAVGDSGIINLSVRVTPNIYVGITYSNIAYATGQSPLGVMVNDQSQLGNDPDPDFDQDSDNNSDPTPITIAPPGKLTLLPKVYLQGSLFGVFSGPLMRDDLRVKNLIPAKSPYVAWNPITQADTITSNTVLTVTGADAIVDWVFVELRDANDSTIVVDSRSALLQRDGDIVEVDGVSPITFNTVVPTDYFVAVRHRNHLGVMSKTAVPLTKVVSTIDFRLTTTPTYVLANSPIHQSQVDVVQGKAMWAGNALYDDQVIFQGTQNDVEVVYLQVINAAGNFFKLPFYILSGYYTGDINMDGEVIFQGTSNDVEYIYQNVINNHNGNSLKQNFFIIQEQLPK
jgi:uncharacterized repeat protein (TIGR01451 family)